MNRRKDQGSSFRKPALLLFVSLMLTVAFGIPGGLAAEKVVKFGYAISLTGVMAPEGNFQKEGLDAWVDAANKAGGIDVGGEKHKVQVVIYDDKSDATTVTKLVEKLVTEDKVHFLLGPFSSGLNLAASSVAEKHKTIMISPVAGAAEIFARGYKYLFGTMLTINVAGQHCVDLMTQVKPAPRKLAILAQNTMWPMSYAAAIKAPAEKKGLKVVYNDKYPAGTADFSPILIEIKRQQPDVLVVVTYTNEGILLAKQMRELKVSVPLLLMPGGPSNPDFATALGDTADYIVYDTAWWTTLPYKGKMFGTSKDYARLMKDRYGYNVSYVGACVSATGVIFQLAIEKAGSLDTEKVRKAIRELNDTTFYGPIKFADNGVNVGTPTTIMQIQKNRPVAVWPPAHADGKIIYPAPKWEDRTR